MIVSRKGNFVFLHNPKVAGSSFRKAIADYHDHQHTFWGVRRVRFLNNLVDMAHLRSWEIGMAAPDVWDEFDRYAVLVFVRNPIRRFISACFPHFEWYRKDVGFAAMTPPEQQNTIARFIDADLTMEKVIGNYRYVHFSPQVWYCMLGTRQVATTIVPLGSGGSGGLSAGFAALNVPEPPRHPRANRRAGKSTDDLITPEIRTFVRGFYAADYELFQSRPELRALIRI